MRLLQVIQELEPGGAERVVLTLAERLAAGGHDVRIASASGPAAQRLGLPDVPLPRLDRRPDRVAVAAWSLFRAVRAWRPDVVHAHNPGMATVTAAATLRGKRPPGLTTCHGVPEDDWRATARTLRLAGLPVVACGPGVAEALDDHGVAVRATVANGVTPAPSPAVRGPLMDELGIDPALRLVVAVGRLADQKHHDLAIEAIGKVAGAALVIVGQGPNREALQARATAMGVADRVRLTGAREDARAILGAADVAVLSSRWEGLPLVGLEAAAAGVPLVATAARGIRELFRDGENAVLVPLDDPDALAAAISKVLTDRGLAERIIEGGRGLAAAHGEDQMVRAYVSLYEEMACRA